MSDKLSELFGAYVPEEVAQYKYCGCEQKQSPEEDAYSAADVIKHIVWRIAYDIYNVKDHDDKSQKGCDTAELVDFFQDVHIKVPFLWCMWWFKAC